MLAKIACARSGKSHRITWQTISFAIPVGYLAEYAVGHVQRILGHKMLVDINEHTIQDYQDARLREDTEPKSINEEVGFLLRLMDVRGDVLRVRLQKKKLPKLKTGARIGKAFTREEKDRLIQAANKARSPHIYPALMLALNAGMRDAEMKTLAWAQINFEKQYLAVGQSKTEAGEGRTIPLNSVLLNALSSYAEWYQLRFGELRPDWYIFSVRKAPPERSDAARNHPENRMAQRARKTRVQGRWHDNWHTLIHLLAPFHMRLNIPRNDGIDGGYQKF